MKKIVKLGDANLIEVANKEYLANIEIDGLHFETHTNDVTEGLGFILNTLTEHCTDREIEEKGNSKRKSYRLSMGITDDGYYEVIATARKSTFNLYIKNKVDLMKFLEAIDLAFPRRPFHEFIGEAAREALRCVTNDSF